MLYLAAQSCPTLCNPMDCSSPGSSVPGDSPGKKTGVVAMPSSRGTSQPRDQTLVSCTAGRLCIMWATSEAQFTPKLFMKSFQLKRGKNVQNNHVCMSLHKSLEMEIFLKLGRRARDWIVQGKPWMWNVREQVCCRQWVPPRFLKSPFLHLYSLYHLLCFTISFPIVQIQITC